MKVSLTALKSLIGGKELPGNSIEELIQKVGAQIGAIEEVVDYGVRYNGIYVVKIVSCVKHHDADKLSICLIDDGGVAQNVQRNQDGLVQVVCGAPNVAEGLLVAWISPGATVPSTYDKDPFQVEARELRGVMSNGMLASPSELAISDDHSGLLIIDPADVGEDLTRPGTEFKNLYGLDDIVLDIENKMFTHRPDCFGLLGVAREIFGIYLQQFDSPDWYWKIPQFEAATGLKLEVENKLPELVPRFMAVAMDNIDIKPSPIWMQALFNRIGIKPINNVVDLTNYIAYITSQPLHAYDYDKVQELSGGAAKIVIRHPKDGEQIELLNGKTISPRAEAIMIATDKVLIGVGGVMGGKSTEVDVNTKRIILECANFDMYSIRKTSMTHGLFTDAVTRFNKGQSPLQNDRVIAKSINEVSSLAGGNQASDVIDGFEYDNELFTNQTVHKPVRATTDFINQRLGLSLSADEVKTLLRNVNFACLDIENSNEIEFYAPFFRTDISLREDIVEEVGRLYGFEKMPVQLPKREMSPAIGDEWIELKSKVRQRLFSIGANEILTYSFVHQKLIDQAGQDAESAFKLSNALSPDLQYYRLSLTPSILSHVHQNIKLGHDEFALFELGKVHSNTELKDEIPRELGRVGLVVASKNKKHGAYFQARKYLEGITGLKLKIVTYEEGLINQHKLTKQMLAPYDPGRSAMVINAQDLVVGVVGEFSQKTLSKFKLPNYSAGFEIFLSALKDYDTKTYTPLSIYPSIAQDVCLEVDSAIKFSEFEKQIDDSLMQVSVDQVVFDKQLIDIYQDKNSPEKKRITYRINFTSYERTMQDDFISKIIDEVGSQMEQKVGAVKI